MEKTGQHALNTPHPNLTQANNTALSTFFFFDYAIPCQTTPETLIINMCLWDETVTVQNCSRQVQGEVKKDFWKSSRADWGIKQSETMDPGHTHIHTHIHVHIVIHIRSHARTYTHTYLNQFRASKVAVCLNGLVNVSLPCSLIQKRKRAGHHAFSHAVIRCSWK